MTLPTRTATPAGIPTDQQDERLRIDVGFAGSVRNSIDKIRSGDLGLLPVVIGLVVICIIFQVLNPVFLSSGNLSNLLIESAPDGVIALGIVFVMLLGEIDLSVGSVSGVSSAVLALLSVNLGLPLIVGIAVAVAGGILIGFFYAQIYNRVGIPSFVITLAGLLGFLGLQLFVLGPTGSVNIPFTSPLVWLGQLAFIPAALSYIIVVILVAAFFTLRFATARRRQTAGLSAQPLSTNAVTSGILLVALLAVVWYLNQARGVGLMFLIFVVLVLIANYAFTATSWGQAIFAIGGNREAARRAGINIRGMYMSCFILCSTLAAVGGLLAAGRLAAASQSSGGGNTNLNAIAAVVIGGTSLFGGRGSAFSALLGVLVIDAIASGLTLLNLDSSINFMVTGAVVLLAVGVDAIARKSRASHGRA